ncbi:MAG: hypothetical protein ACI8RD_012557 [Bacillariaceae sp.]|jgi:hypothetical protein
MNTTYHQVSTLKSRRRFVISDFFTKMETHSFELPLFLPFEQLEAKLANRSKK